uniref:uncharacterized protein LOC117611507 n=1 Tax=Osmia lignaria TaxID=473952 RepID=UPI0014788109|nr:uncharacterized protein LOC117611507 [Osmia lignaria]
MDLNEFEEIGQYILDAVCIRNIGPVFNNNLAHRIGRTCIDCAFKMVPEAKEMWFFMGWHNHVSKNTDINYIHCIICRKVLCRMRPAASCTSCRSRLFAADNEHKETFREGFILPTLDPNIFPLKDVVVQNEEYRVITHN